ncbi:MAG: hypothetical protein A3G34_16345 [Candidatus Lindowbacteria bacterium RIFCSPLOWO2_12_FULL_62_27]|nr:MAG: hypothetical protein A3G34_16345 [Candidatus Lindowbacteria bacterium RIFCSPLOWO2_12_FULL_62_27]
MDILTGPDAAKVIGVSEELVAKYCRQGRIQGAALKGRTWLIPRESVAQFVEIRKQYRPGRPPLDRRLAGAILWRERPGRMSAADRAKTISTRLPALLPATVSREACRKFVNASKTRLQKIARQAMMDELYGVARIQRPSPLEMVSEKLQCVVDRIEPTDLYDLCVLHEQFPDEFDKALARLIASMEANALLVYINRCLETEEGPAGKVRLTRAHRRWMETAVPKLVRAVTKAGREELGKHFEG